MTTKETALKVAAILDEKKAADIVIIDIAERSAFADYFVIATASSVRQLGSLTDELDDKLFKQFGLEAKNIEGRGSSEWVLMDYGDLVVNLFTEEARNKYHLEKVWGDCEMINYVKSED